MGECHSCRDLARGGPGSIDVIEIDAASHGGVDDARDLRERAFFAPVSSAYKVYIIDEAHMVTTQGFNALLKLVEEPPPHLRFIFATTEPDKVLPTIRSRTHHYPFRLIPPRLLSTYLTELCEKEGVAIEPAALPLVVRAGGGSARDTLSVLDQLLGGAGPEGVTHALASGLLGYTPDTLLDEVVDAFAAADGAAVFGVVDKVIETGQDPRRFTEDLLRRLRDLVIVAAVPGRPGHRADRRLPGPGRAAGGAGGPLRLGRPEPGGRPGRHRPDRDARRHRAPPAAGADLRPGPAARRRPRVPTGMQARLDRLERRVRDQPGTALRPRPVGGRPAAPRRPTARAGPPAPAPARRAAASRRPPSRPRAPSPAGAAEPGAAPVGRSPSRAAAAAGRPLSLVDVRRLWPDIVDATKLRRRVTWIHLTQNAQVVARRRDDADPRLRQRRRPGVLRDRRQPRDRPAGGHRRGRRRLADRDHRRPGRRRRPRRSRAGARAGAAPRRRPEPARDASPSRPRRPSRRGPRSDAGDLGGDEPAEHRAPGRASSAPR